MEATHVIGICGGAVAGSEAAAYCAERGVLAVVFEQNERPYGKIEDGLPRWHAALREKEYGRIDDNLDRDGVLFVPDTRIGRDIDWDDVTDDLGLHAVVLANGAWRDRALREDIHAYDGRGVVYQNAFVYWFNHYHEADYAGPVYDVADGAVVVGGGLASIDVVKIINLELYARALRARGIAVDVIAMEHAGIDKTLADHGLTAEELGVRGCTLLYRRRAEDMPLASADNPTPERLEKLKKARVKILDKVRRKYLVNFQGQALAVAPIVEGDRLRGVVCRRTRLDGRKVFEIEGSEFELRSDLVVSSIGSIPERIAGVPMRGELYAFRDWDTGELDEDGKIFGLGNVLTGKGNIKESRKNSRAVIAPIIDRVLAQPPLSTDAMARVMARIRQRWDAVGYSGYRAWIDAHPPAP